MSPADRAEKPSVRVPCAGAVVRDGEGRVLLVQRGHEPSLGLWSVPGGRIEPGESARAAAAREVREETGLDVHIGAELVRVVVGDYEITDFAATVAGGELRAGDDAADVRWCTLEELATLPLTPSMYDALPALGLT